MTTEAKVTGKVIAYGTFRLSGPAHLGGGESNTVDMALYRDASGSFLVPGSSIAGAARSYLAHYFIGAEAFDYMSKGKMSDTELVGALQQQPRERQLRDREHEFGLTWLFGAGLHEDATDKRIREGWQSPLIISDALLSTDALLAVRDGVRIDPVSGQALVEREGSRRKGAKYDLEVIESGAEFKFKLELVIREGYKDSPVKSLLNLLLKAFEDGHIPLGAKTRRGFGRGKVNNWQVVDYDFANPPDVVAWIDGGKVPQTREEWSSSNHLATYKARHSFFDLEAEFKLEDSLIIREYSEAENEADTVMFSAAGQTLIPATSAAGVIRHRAEKILRTLSTSPVEVIASLSNPLFGFASTDGGENTPQRAGRLRIEENPVDQMKEEVQTRVKIDRLTGGTMTGFLIEEEPIWGSKPQPGSWKLQLRLWEPREYEVALLLHVLKDLWVSDLAVGGESGIGRGVLKGSKASLHWRKADETEEKWEFAQVETKLEFTKGSPQTLNNYASQLIKAVNSLTGGN